MWIRLLVLESAARALLERLFWRDFEARSVRVVVFANLEVFQGKDGKFVDEIGVFAGATHGAVHSCRELGWRRVVVVAQDALVVFSDGHKGFVKDDVACGR